MNDKKKLMVLLDLFLMQREVSQKAKKDFKTNNNSITKLFISSDLMQFFLNNINRQPWVTTISMFKPISDITCRVGDEGNLNGVNFEIIKGKEKVYQGIEMFQTYFDE